MPQLSSTVLFGELHKWLADVVYSAQKAEDDMAKVAALTVVQSDTGEKKAQHRATAQNLTYVPGYPKKLVIYQLAASPFWWARYYADGKILRRSTKEKDKRAALKFAKGFYDEILYKQRQGYVLNSHADFEQCANEVLEQQDAKVSRNEMSAMMQQNDKYRLQKEVLPFFRSYDLKNIDYFVVEKFINKLSNDSLTPATISSYLGVVRKTLSHAQRKGFIQAVPQFPKLKKMDTPRGWFNTKEYTKLWRSAKKLQGQTWEIRKLVKDGKEEIFVCPQQSVPPKRPTALSKKIAASEKLRRVDMTVDMYNLIVFMVNSFIRPTDIKWMQHKHVEIIENEHTYLRLSLPISKKHDKPIVTMSNAVAYYKRQKAHYEALGMAGKEDYVFMPEYGPAKAGETKEDVDKRRGAALTQLQRQFSAVLADTGLAKGARDEERTIYSLRHTCIMYRLLYGDGMDLLTLARNARTSPEMIDRFYASHLSGEMNIEMLQGKRKARKRKEAA